MARVIITSELASILRDIRIQSKITTVDLARMIKKSQAYVSRLENGEVKTISEDLLVKIFELICQNCDSQEKRLERIYNSLEIKYTLEDIRKQLWFLNFDTVMRQIPVPKELSIYLNNKINSLGLDSKKLLSQINANDDLSLENKSEKYEFNRWYYQKTPKEHEFIKINIKEDQYEKILKGSQVSASYIHVLAILFYINKSKYLSSKKILNDDDYNNLLKKTEKELFSFKFDTILTRHEKLLTANNSKEVEEIISKFDLDNIKIVRKILEQIYFASELDVAKTNKCLEKFYKNMQWDLGFMLKLISLDFSKIKETTYSNKLALIKEIEVLVEKYKTIQDTTKTIESY